MEDLNYALIIELAVLIVGFVMFFMRQNYLMEETKKDIESLKKDNHKDADDIHNKLNKHGEALVEANTRLDVIQRKVVNGG